MPEMKVFAAVDSYIANTSVVKAEFYYDLNLGDGDSIDWKASTFKPSIAQMTNVYEVICGNGAKKFLAIDNGDHGMTAGHRWFNSFAEALDSVPADHEPWTFL